MMRILGMPDFMPSLFIAMNFSTRARTFPGLHEKTSRTSNMRSLPGSLWSVRPERIDDDEVRIASRKHGAIDLHRLIQQSANERRVPSTRAGAPPHVQHAIAVDQDRLKLLVREMLHAVLCRTRLRELAERFDQSARDQDLRAARMAMRRMPLRVKRDGRTE